MVFKDKTTLTFFLGKPTRSFMQLLVFNVIRYDNL